MNDRRAGAVTGDALNAFSSLLEISDSPDDFLAGVDQLMQVQTNLLQLPVDYGVAEHLMPGKGSTGRDIENGPAVYEYLGSLDPANASDPRLWTYLAFATYRAYMEARWPLTIDINWKGRVEDRWLLQNASRRDLIRHGVSRLWWVASLTYDAKCEFPLAAATADPFAYTRAAFRNEDRIQGLFDREVGSVASVVRAVLERGVGGDSQITDKEFRILMKEVNLVYGFRDIQVLDDSQTRELVNSLM